MRLPGNTNWKQGGFSSFFIISVEDLAPFFYYPSFFLSFSNIPLLLYYFFSNLMENNFNPAIKTFFIKENAQTSVSLNEFFQSSAHNADWNSRHNADDTVIQKPPALLIHADSIDSITLTTPSINTNTICQYCFKNFSSKNGLRHHMHIHTGETKYECSFVKHLLGIAETISVTCTFTLGWSHFNVHWLAHEHFLIARIVVPILGCIIASNNAYLLNFVPSSYFKSNAEAF